MLGGAAVHSLARHGSLQRLETMSGRMARKPPASTRTATPASRKPAPRSALRLSQPRVAVKTPIARVSTPQIRAALRHTGKPNRSVKQPILLGGGARVCPFSPARGGLGAREPLLRAAATRAIAKGAAQQRPASASVHTSQRSRPALNLAAQVNRRIEQQPKSGSQSRDRGLMDSLSPPPTSGFGGRERSRAGRSGGEQGNDGRVSLSGDFVVNGRRLGELALSSAAKGGASAQTGARSPNFRRNALPSGISAPLP